MVIKDFHDIVKIEKLLIENGLNIESANRKSLLIEKSARKLLSIGNKESDSAYGYYVPGRIEVLGKHTDYAGGSSLIIAADKGFCILSTPRNDKKICIYSMEMDEKIDFELSTDITAKTGDWSNYPMNVIRRVVLNFGDNLQGCDIVFDSDLPQASGMSSSSAFMIAIFFAISGVNDLENYPDFKINIKSKIDFAEYLATIENGLTFKNLIGDKGVGTFGGSEDHTAILNCKANIMSEYSYCPVKFQKEIKLPEDYIFVICSSGVQAVKTGNAREKYNMVSKLVSTLVDLWNENNEQKVTNLATIITNSTENRFKLINLIETDNNKHFPKNELIDRLNHFIKENYEIIPNAISSLQNQDLEEFGRQVDLSQNLATSLLKNQVGQTVFLTKSARECGAIASSAFGAGFGGSVWALVKRENKESFIQCWKNQYKIKFPENIKDAQFFNSNAGQATFQIE